MKQDLTLEERLAELYAEMDVIVARYIDERAAACIGVPRGSIENSYLARAGGCRCEEYKLIQAKLEAERKLADAQAIPAG